MGWELRNLTLDAVQRAEIDARLAYALERLRKGE